MLAFDKVKSDFCVFSIVNKRVREQILLEQTTDAVQTSNSHVLSVPAACGFRANFRFSSTFLANEQTLDS